MNTSHATTGNALTQTFTQNPEHDTVSAILSRVRNLTVELVKASKVMSNNVDKIVGPLPTLSSGEKEPSQPEPGHVLFQARQVEIELEKHLSHLLSMTKRLEEYI
jgi:hypothetical protein